LTVTRWRSRAGLVQPGIAAFGSFIAGTAGLVGLMFLASPLAEFAIKFGPTEYFSLMVLGMSVVIYLTLGSILRD